MVTELVDSKNCPHSYTFTRDHLFSSNPLFSKKTCELCGGTIVLDRKYKIFIVLFVAAIVVLLVNSPNFLKDVLPDVSYFAKGLVVVLVFVVVYSLGIYFIMRRATYHLYTAPESSASAEVFERSRARAARRTEALLRRRKPDD